MEKLHLERLKKLADHLLHGELGHKEFRFDTYNNDGSKETPCGTAGCALGECPIVFPEDWHFDPNRKYRPGLKTGLPTDPSAIDFFALSEDECDELFYPNSPAGITKINLDEFATKEQVANKIIKFIEIKEQKNNSKMKILEVVSIKSQGITTNQIVHQEGWDYRGPNLYGGAYVRWSGSPGLTEYCIYLRGSNKEKDLDYFKGTINYDKITDFFNSRQSPLDLTGDKPHYSTISQKTLDEKFGVGKYTVLKGGYVWNKSRDLVLCLDNLEPFSQYTSPELAWWVTENYSYAKRKVTYTSETTEPFEKVEITKHVWSIT